MYIITTIIIYNSLNKKQEREQLRGIGSGIIRNLKPKENDASQCDGTTPYRSIDGTCNNLNHPVLGSANSPLIRFPGAGAEYADGISQPRQAQDGSNLPNARRISFMMFTNEDKPSTITSHMTMIWGELIFL